MTKTKRQPPANLKPQAAATPLKTTKVGIRTLVFYDSVLEALGIDQRSSTAPGGGGTGRGSQYRRAGSQITESRFGGADASRIW